MDKFKVGDRVKCIKGNYSCIKIGESAKIVSISEEEEFLELPCSPGWNPYKPENFIKIGDPMSKYDELKSKIENIDKHTSLKEADDILQEIWGNKDPQYHICVRVYSNVGSVEIQDTSRVEVVSFSYRSQCEKLSAFKETFMYLLNRSNIKKSDKQSKIDDLQRQLDELRKEM